MRNPQLTMAKYLLLIPFLILASLSLSAQKNKPRKIIVVATDTTNLFNRVALAFYDKEYTIDNKDPQAGFISTKEKAIKAGYSTDVKLRAQIKDSIIVFTGEMRVNVSLYGQPASFDPIYEWGMKGTPARLSWMEMEGIAKEFGPVTYAR